MEQMKLAWVYRFWIVVGIVAIMPIVGFFVDTSKLARNAAQRGNELKGLRDSLDKASKAANPNEKWVEAVEALKGSLDQQVGVAWVDLYKKQLNSKTWPEEVKEAFVKAGEKGEVDSNVRLKYQELYRPQFLELYKLVQPVGLADSKGLVYMDAQVLQGFIQPWGLGENVLPPTIPEAWQAQEDIWLLRSMLSVVARANEGSTKVQESAVKRIVDLRIGSVAVDSTFTAKNVKEQLTPRGDAPAAAATATAKAEGREIKGPIYHQIPVKMHLIVDQPRVLQVLAEFGNSDIPLQVKQVSFEELPLADRNRERVAALLGETVKKGELVSKGATALAKEDEFYHMARLEVYARAIIYKTPPKIEQEEAAAKAAAAQSGTAQPSATASAGTKQ